MKHSFKIISVLLAGAALLLLAACERDTTSARPNLPPNTTLANIPVDSSTIFALATLHWDGEDDDGFIKGYQYRYTTKHLNRSDFYEHPWTDTKETSLTIAFESSDDLNIQSFELRAVDNNDAVDPTPSKKAFFTPKTMPPVTKLLFPENNKIFFAQESATDWWPGIKIAYKSTDQEGEVVEYAWAVDDGEWNWTQDTTLFIKPEFFSSIEGKHKIRVTSRDNTNLVDEKGDSIFITLIKSSFSKEILIIDATDEAIFPFPSEGRPTDTDIDNFYADIFRTNEGWDFKKKGMPPKDLLGQYKMIIWHADNPYSSEKDIHKLPIYIDDIMDYMNVGGDFILSGWRILKCFADKDKFPRVFKEGEFIHDYLHIKTVDETVLYGDFIGADGIGGFSDIMVDPDKIKYFPYNGKLAQVNYILDMAGFTNRMLLYKNDLSSLYYKYRSQTVGLRYYGSVFDALVLGFPLYFIEKESAAKLGSDILQSMGY